MSSIRICVTIDKNQMDFCKSQGYKPSRILRAGIQKLLDRGTDINFQKANQLLQEKIEKMSYELERAVNKIQELENGK